MLLSDLIYFIKENRYKGRRQSFQLNDEGLRQYLVWAFNRNSLLVVSNENGLSGVAITYALHKPYDGYIRNMLPQDEEVSEQEELKNELCVMDWIANNKKTRISLINQFQARFPNWENQIKWGIQFGQTKILTNKYMNLLKGIN